MTTAFSTVLHSLLAYHAQDASGPTDYCSVNLCRVGVHHTACNSTENFGPHCGSAPELVDLSKGLSDYIVERHNVYRNEVARGGLQPKIPKAIRMTSMTWDEELAKIASLHVKECEFKHDRCRNTKNYKRSGQNIGIMETSSKKMNIKSFIKDTVKEWFKEHMNTPRETIERYQSPKDPNVMIGHFTALVTDRSNKVGCGVISYHQDGVFQTAALMVCNYASTNVIGIPVYKTGPVPGSDCVKGTHKKYRALCVPDEPINPNSLS